MSKIKVALRVRPLSTRELGDNYPVVVGVDENSAFITDIRVPERPSADSRQRFRQFHFDHAFWLTDEADDGASQEEIYDEMGPPLQESILEGYNACLLAYGQSGTGKTHTMLGSKEDPGLIPRLCQGLWEKFKTHCSTGNKTFRMEVSFMEIYREKVRDLLTPREKPLKLREHPQLGPHVQGLSRIEISEGLSILDLLWEGEKRRATGATGSNRRSSRSHAIWTLYLTSTRRSTDGSELITRNQVHLVDLAGSEKADLITTKHLLAEGKDINRSLVSLGNVISSLAERAQYIPYRDSTLTWLLKDSLGGNATTAIIITASPASLCHAQTLNSLRFAQRARLVENQPKINVTKSENRAGNKRNTGIFSGMSSFDLKKDISKLASMIRSAQTNGGILRSLAPSNGWNRLISAIEHWSYSEAEQGSRGDRQHVPSNDTPATTTSSTPSTSITGQNQVGSKPDSSDQSTPPSLQTTPKKVIQGTEVFIPISNSMKCLTWRQEEVHQVQKSAGESEVDDEVFMSAPTTPRLEMKVNQLKYFGPVHYPVSRNLESDFRISEKIHGTIEQLKEPIQILPTEVIHKFESSPVICDKCPTIVNPQPIKHQIKESVGELLDENLNFVKSMVHSKGQESNFCFRIPKVSDFSNETTLPIPVFQSTDEDEVNIQTSLLRSKRFSKLRVIPGDKVAVSRTEQDFRLPSPISSSSYESIQLPRSNKTVPSVKIVENSNFNFIEIEEKLNSINRECLHQVATVSRIENPKDECHNFKFHRKSPGTGPRVPLDASTSSKFRNYFVRELSEMENIGKQIKELQQKTERYNKLKPYLSKIDQVMLDDHTKEDPELDAKIEQCSGWNVAIELEKVQNEISSINKILRSGVSEKLPSESSLSNPESSGSVSLESRRSSNASSTNHDILYHSRSIGIPHPTTPKPIPILTSTPKKSINQKHTPSTFWSDFYVKNGPGGDSQNNQQYTQLHTETDSRLQQKWKPFLPKTHQYLCHQQKGHGVQNWTNPCHNLPPRYIQESTSFPPPCYQAHSQQRRQVQNSQRSNYHRSLSSEGSSVYDGSQSDHYFPPAGYHASTTEYCSCQDSLETNHSYSSIDNNEFPNQYHHDPPYQNGFSNSNCGGKEDLGYNYPKNYLVRNKFNRNSSKLCGNYVK